MTSIGNNMLNSVWEANAIGCRKPVATSSRYDESSESNSLKCMMDWFIG